MNDIIVQKFGGTSVADLACIKNVARIIIKYLENKEKVVAVVSARAGDTNMLLAMAEGATSINILKKPYPAEIDSLVSTGEQVSASLLSLVLREFGIRSETLMGWQIPIITDDFYGNARIQKINHETILNLVNQGIVPIIAGFQGVNSNNKVTTLGRGGSDTTAVAVSAAIGAKRCDIFTDVDGVYSADPRLVSNARLLENISYEDVLEMASNGAKVLERRSVELAYYYKVHLRILNTFKELGNQENLCTNISEGKMENYKTSSISHKYEYCMGNFNIPVTEINSILNKLSEMGVGLEMINISEINEGKVGVTIFFHKGDAQKVLDLNEDSFKINIKENLVKITMLGINLAYKADQLSKIYKNLEGIRIYGVEINSTKASFFIDELFTTKVLEICHEATSCE